MMTGHIRVVVGMIHFKHACAYIFISDDHIQMQPSILEETIQDPDNAPLSAGMFKLTRVHVTIIMYVRVRI